MKISRLHATFATILLLNAGDGTVSTVFPAFLDERGYAVSNIGFVVSVFAVLSLISRLPSGLAYKPQHARQMMYVSAGAFAATLLLYNVADNTASLIVVRAISGFSFGAATTLNMALLMDILPQGSNRARTMAFYSGAMSGGFAIGNSAGGWLADTFGYQWTFGIAATLPLLAAFLTPRVFEASGLTKGGAPKARGKTTLRGKLREVRNGKTLVVAQMAFTLNALHYMLTTYLPLYALNIGLSLTSVGFLRATHSIFGMVTRPFGGEATRFASADRIANSGLVLVAIIIALTPSFDSMMVLVPMFVLLGTARGIVLVNNTVSLAEGVREDPARRGVASGIFNAARDLGSVCGPILGGIMAAHIGIENMLRAGPTILMAVYFAVLIITTRARRRAAPIGERQF